MAERQAESDSEFVDLTQEDDDECKSPIIVDLNTEVSRHLAVELSL